MHSTPGWAGSKVVQSTALEPQFAGLPTDFFDRAAKAITAAIPQTERHTLDGQGHVVAPELMARVLKTFFNQ